MWTFNHGLLDPKSPMHPWNNKETRGWAEYMSPTGERPAALRLADAHRRNEALGVATCADCYGPCHEDEGYTNEQGQTICQGCNHENIWFDQNGDTDE